MKSERMHFGNWDSGKLLEWGENKVKTVQNIKCDFSTQLLSQFYTRCIFKKGTKKVHLVICNDNTLNGKTYEIECCAASVVVIERQWTGLWTGREKKGRRLPAFACNHADEILPSPSFTSH